MSAELKRKKLKYRASRRGTKEADSVIGGFVEKFIDRFDNNQLRNLEILLDIPDADLMNMSSPDSVEVSGESTELLEMLRDYQKQLLVNK